MREDAFRAFLTAAGYTDKSVAGRMARARSVERRLRADLDALDLDEAALPDLRDRLAARGSGGGVLANELNAIRTYHRFRSGEPSPASAVTPLPIDSAVPPERRSALMAGASVARLLALHGEVLDELRARAVIRTANAPVGDYAEWLFARAFGWTLAGNSTAKYDALDEPTGRRFQIKGRRLGGAGSRQLGVIRDLEGFDALAAILFHADLSVARAALIPAAVVRKVARRVDHVNGWRVMLPDAMWLAADVEDVSDQLRAAALTA